MYHHFDRYVEFLQGSLTKIQDEMSTGQIQFKLTNKSTIGPFGK